MTKALAPFLSAAQDLFRPLIAATRSARDFRALLRRLGHDVDVDDSGLAALTWIADLATLIESAAETTRTIQATTGDDVAPAIVSTVETLGLLFDLIADISSSSGGVLDADVAADLAAGLPDLLITTYLESSQPAIYAVLRLSGVITDDEGALDPDDARFSGNDRLPYEAQILDWSKLGDWLSDPAGALQTRFDWGGDFEHELLFAELARLLRALGVAARRPTIDARFVGTDGWIASDHAERYSLRGLALPFRRGLGAGGVGWIDLGLLILPSPSTPSGDIDGLYITPMADFGYTASAKLSPDWTLSIPITVEATGAIGMHLHPSGLSFEADIPEASIGLELEGAPKRPWILFGAPGSTRLELGGVRMGLTLDGGSEPEVLLEAELLAGAGQSQALTLTVDPGEGDSFLADVLGDGGSFSAGLDATLSWSSLTGFSFGGGVGLDIEIPTDIRFGPFWLSQIHVGINADADEGARLDVDVAAGLELGPVAVVVEGIGASLTLAARDGDYQGVFGNLDVDVGFKPPNGLGLSVDIANVASGGGYLYIDAEAGEYAGIAELDIFGVGVTAIGILTTQLPDDVPGWSLFLSVSATFTGLQLGFGFTLNGVGGLIAINRAVDIDALGDGIREGALDALLFPDDPVANAPTILSQIDTIFPTQKGQYVFGPVVQLGWGTPSLFEAELGVIIQLPEPLTISLLGSFEAILPSDEAALLELRVDVAGTLNVTEGTLSVDASLRDSKVAGLVLSGDMALRAAFLGEPSFLFSFGGFNPHFTPPDNFPSLKRLSVSLDTGDDLRIGLGGYFALTSNTVQFGAFAELWAKAIGLTVEGYFEFDALVQFSPFWFIVDLGFGVDVKAGNLELFGVHLAVQLEGPNPWYVLGTATVKVLGIKKDFRVEATIGRKESEPPQELVDVRARLIDAVSEQDAWAEADTSAEVQAVTLADPDPSDTTLRVHPAGAVEVRQRVAPLERTLDHFGNAAIDGGAKFSMGAAQLGEDSVDSESIEDHFAPAQFFTMKDEDKISSPSFDRMPAGLRIGDEGVSAGPERAFEIDYEQIIRDPDVQGEDDVKLADRFTLGADALAAALSRSAVARLRKDNRLQVGAASSPRFVLSDTRYVVAEVDSGARVAELSPSAAGHGWSEARELLLSADGASAKQLVPNYELDEEDAA